MPGWTAKGSGRARRARVAYISLRLPSFGAGFLRRAGLAKYASRIFLAAGAADSAPKPPSSIVTKVTIRGFGYGARTPYQDWSACGGRWAVPVLPATGIGKLPKTSNEVPPPFCAASCSPSRIAARYSGSIWTWRRGSGSNSFSTRPAASSTSMPTCGVTTVPPLASAA